jgi:hypothetical protein
MITNNVDEAVLLADRIVSLTRGPGATVGATITVALPRPRSAMLVAHDAHAVRVRSSVVEALTSHDTHPYQRGARALSAGVEREPAANGFGAVERLGES